MGFRAHNLSCPQLPKIKFCYTPHEKKMHDYETRKAQTSWLLDLGPVNICRDEMDERL